MIKRLKIEVKRVRLEYIMGKGDMSTLSSSEKRGSTRGKG